MSPGLEPMLGAVGTMGGCVGSVQPKGVPGFRGGSGGRAGSVLPCECFRLDPDHPQLLLLILSPLHPKYLPISEN